MTIVRQGQCGFLDCEKENQPGEWPIGSFMCEEHQLITLKVKEHLRKNNKWDTKDDVPRCSRTGGEDYCYNCFGPGKCDWSDANDIL